ncbi:hypothetical protein AB0875_27250 [Micromonospora gifhornensis]|uniref:hypothetical protein n=1 Tax=Micromonospora gifhornensis TaxID=84594 RepID=UPI00345480FC
MEHTVAGLVREEAIERVALNELFSWAKSAGVDVKLHFPSRGSTTIFAPSTNSLVYDIDMVALASVCNQLSKEKPAIRARIGNRVGRDTPLLATAMESKHFVTTSPFILSQEGPGDRIGGLLVQLKEEGIEALRSESTSGINAVVESYTQLWLAWPRAWAVYGQRLVEGFMSQMTFLALTPTDSLRSDLRSLIDAAIERGLREQAVTLARIAFRVGREAVELDAPDVLKEATGLARSILRFPPDSQTGLDRIVNREACECLVSLCKYVVVPRLRSVSGEADETKHAAELARIVFRDITECLKTLIEHRAQELFEYVDGEFRDVLEYWEDDDLYGDNDQAWERTEEEERQRKFRAELITLRTSLRISLLGWGLHVVSEALDANMARVLRKVANSLSDIEQADAAVAYSMQPRNGVLHDWVLSSLPTGQVHFIDDEGPLLRAFALILLTSPGLKALSRGWLSEERVRRLDAYIDHLASSPVIVGSNDSAPSSQSLADRAKEFLSAAYREQLERERARLIASSLDQTKVDDFKRHVFESWSKGRILPAIMELGASTLRTQQVESWGDESFGYGPDLHPKGRFVSSSNWIDSDHVARKYGSSLARSEASTVVSAIKINAKKIRAHGSALQRTAKALLDLAESGYTPSLILVPADFELHRGLGMPLRWQRRNKEGPASSRIVGKLYGIPVIEWHEISESRVYVVDLGSFVKVHEGVGADLQPLPPECSIQFIDLDEARKIAAHLNAKRDREGDTSIEEVQTQVKITINRPFRISEVVPQAGRSVWIPPGPRGRVKYRKKQKS